MNLKRTISASLITLFMVVPLLAGQSRTQSGRKADKNQQSGSAQTAAQTQMKIGVLPFTDATGTGGSQVGVALSRMVQAELTHSTNVMAYALDLGNVKQEDLDQQKAVEIASAHHVAAVILGTVLEADTSDTTHGAAASVFGQLIGGDVHTKKATVTFQGDLFNVATGAKVDSFRVTATDTEKKVGPNAWTRLGDINSTDWSMDNNPLGKALQKAVAKLVKKVAADEPKIQAHANRNPSHP